jgi:hypothetical protein
VLVYQLTELHPTPCMEKIVERLSKHITPEIFVIGLNHLKWGNWELPLSLTSPVVTWSSRTRVHIERV